MSAKKSSASISSEPCRHEVKTLMATGVYCLACGAKVGKLPSFRRAKYGNVRTTVDGISFHSKREAKRYEALKLLLAHGEISELKLQPRFKLRVEGVLICTYVADFEYKTATGKEVVEDVKGFKTDVYRIKANLFQALYPSIDFRVVR